MTKEAIENALHTALKPLGFAHVAQPLSQYLYQLDKWNKTYNLTAVRDVFEMIPRHILDSLAISPWLHGGRLIDVGTGPGLPGIPLALTHPDKSFTLLDSNGKKTRFLRHVKREMGLDNVEVIESRVESYQPSQAFDTVISRAFSSLDQMTGLTRHLLAEKGYWLAMKGRRPDEELQHINYSSEVHSYAVAGQTGERCCVIIHPC